MGKIAVDEARCTGCVVCMQVCVLGNFAPDGKGKVRAADGIECFDCGHCVASCPAGAMSHAELPAGEFVPIDRAQLPDYDHLLGLLKARRSRREFRDEPVPEAVIQQLLDAAVQAPSSLNTNSVRYTVITNRDVISGIAARCRTFFRNMQGMMRTPVGKLVFRTMMGGAFEEMSRLFPLIDTVLASEDDLVLYNAPCVILQHAPKTSIFAKDDYCYAAQNIQLAAETLGLGSCVIGLVTEPMNRDKSMRAFAGIPADHKVYCTIALGYPRFRYRSTVAKRAPEVKYVR